MNIGAIHFTGNEESGGCWFCGGELPKRRRHWCCDEHAQEYLETYSYSSASSACIRRANDRCENCHKDWNELYQPSHSSVDATIEVHHIIPLKGEDRAWHELNRPDNLIALCHQCHLQVHKAMKLPKVAKNVRDKQDLITTMKKYGQLELL